MTTSSSSSSSTRARAASSLAGWLFLLLSVVRSPPPPPNINTNTDRRASSSVRFVVGFHHSVVPRRFDAGRRFSVHHHHHRPRRVVGTAAFFPTDVRRRRTLYRGDDDNGASSSSLRSLSDDDQYEEEEEAMDDEEEEEAFFDETDEDDEDDEFDDDLGEEEVNGSSSSVSSSSSFASSTADVVAPRMEPPARDYFPPGKGGTQEDWEAGEAIYQDLLQKIENARRELDELDEEEFVENLTPEQIEIIEGDEVEAEVEREFREKALTEDELEDLLARSAEEAASNNDDDDEDERELVPALDDPVYGRENATAVAEDLVELKKAYVDYRRAEESYEEFAAGRVEGVHPPKVEAIDDEHLLTNVLDQHTVDEILNLDDEVETIEDGNPGSPDWPEIRKQRRQLIYDLDFNITNVFLASFKVNPDAPVLLEHWMYQLRNWTRYDYVRERNFNFTWSDVDNADVDELDRYWKGVGRNDGAPKPSVAENPNVIEWDEHPLDFEEEYMLALEAWMEEVYAEEDDFTLDDEDVLPEDNPACPEHGTNRYEDEAEADKKDSVLKDVKEFEEKYSHMSDEWRDNYVSRSTYEIENKEEEDFRGHLVIACSPAGPDIDMAEKLTVRMGREFGEKVFVETRVVGHAKPEDYLYEIWLESWEVELLHSKRRAVFQKDWDGPREIDDEYIDDLVKRIDFIISDDYKNSFLMTSDAAGD